MSNQIIKNRVINNTIYVINPSTFNTYTIDVPDTLLPNVKQATLFCGACSSVENVTHENSKTLPYTSNVYYYERIYSGRCLKKECIEKFVKENERYDEILQKVLNSKYFNLLK